MTLLERRALGLLVALTAWGPLQSEVKAQAPPAKELHVYLVMGDSGLTSPEAKASPALDRCYLLNTEGQWEAAIGPLNRYSSLLVEGETPVSGPVYGFAKSLLEKDENISIGLVVNTSQHASISRQGFKDSVYRASRKRAKAAIKSGTLRGVIWLQGEKGLTLSFQDHFKDMLTYLRMDFRRLDLPAVIGQLPGQPAISTQLSTLVSSVHGTRLISGEHSNDGEHYAAAMRNMQHDNEARLKKTARRDIPIFDTHVHAFHNRKDGLDPVAAWMKKRNIERCLVSPIGDARATTEAQRTVMLENYAKHKGRILRFCLIEPGEVDTIEEAVAILEKEKAMGAVGFGEHYGRNRMFDDPENMLLYAACEKVGLPVMFHIDQNKNMDEKGLPRVERVLKTYPKCKLIAHASWWLHFPEGTCDRQLQKFPNLYADISGQRMAAMLNRDRSYTREFLIRNQDKVLFGSDAGWWSFGKEERELQFELFEQLDLPEDVREKIYRGNAEKLFSLERSNKK